MTSMLLTLAVGLSGYSRFSASPTTVVSRLHVIKVSLSHPPMFRSSLLYTAQRARTEELRELHEGELGNQIFPFS